MKTLKKISNYKNFHINHTCTLKEAMFLMKENGDGCVVLLKENFPIAILTESNIINSLDSKIDLSAKAYSFATTTVITANENRPIDFAFNFLSTHNIRRVILVDKDQKFTGLVRQEDLFDYLDEDVYKVDLKISDIIKTKQNIITVKEDASIYDALNQIKKYNVGSIVVVDEKSFVGILTEKDILKLTYLETNMKEPINSYMTKPVISVDKDTLVTNVIELMKNKKIRRILITNENGKLLTILTNRDILKHIKGNYSRILHIKIKHAQEIMDFLPEAIVEVFYNDEQQIVYWMNKKAKEFFGDSIIDKEPIAIFSKQDWQEIYNHFQTNLSIQDKRVYIKDQNFEISGSISKNLNNSYIKLILKNVTTHETKKKELQKEIDKQIEKRLENEYLLMQQSKLATMGEMIGHIAHQWRQPLAQLGGIFMNLDAAYDFKELSPKYFKQKIKNGNQLIKYMSHTIDDFRHFFEPNRSKKSFDIEEYIKNAINIIQASLTYYHIDLEVITPKKSIYISGYPSEFAQVILNLLDNAKDILIERKIDNPKIIIEMTTLDDAIFVKIRDNGGGIDKEIIEDIFDMYFTTKSKKGGSGLGLYMSKLIIESKIMGEISVKNSAKGAEFVIKINNF